MSVTVKDVEYVAVLARLSLSDEEKQSYAGQLNAILEYVEQLNRIDTTNVEPLAQVIEMTNVTREDEVTPSLPREVALQNAPARSEKFFKVPTVRGER